MPEIARISSASLSTSPSKPSSLRRTPETIRGLSVAGSVVELGNEEVPGHDALHARLDRRPERKQGLSEVARGRRKREMRVDGRVAVAGKVLCTRGDANPLSSCNKGGDVPRNEVRVRAERADADDRVPRVRVDVGNRGEVHRHADPRQLRGDRGRNALGQLRVVDHAEGEVARVGTAVRSLEASDIAALLVDRDDELLTFGP